LRLAAEGGQVKPRTRVYAFSETLTPDRSFTRRRLAGFHFAAKGDLICLLTLKHCKQAANNNVGRDRPPAKSAQAARKMNSLFLIFFLPTDR
jgi:hypothetical protein